MINPSFSLTSLSSKIKIFLRLLYWIRSEQQKPTSNWWVIGEQVTLSPCRMLPQLLCPYRISRFGMGSRKIYIPTPDNFARFCTDNKLPFRRAPQHTTKIMDFAFCVDWFAVHPQFFDTVPTDPVFILYLLMTRTIKTNIIPWTSQTSSVLLMVLPKYGQLRVF